MKKSHKKVIIISIICVIVAAFAALNVLWYLHYSDFMDYRSVMKTEDVGGEISYVLRQNGYKYSIKVPSYLDFGGNLAIVEQNDTDDSGSKPTLLIWPKLFKEDKFGIMLRSKDEYNTTYQIYVDKSGNPIFTDDDSEEYKEEIQQILLDNKTSVDGLIKAMNDVWNIG